MVSFLYSYIQYNQDLVIPLNAKLNLLTAKKIIPYEIHCGCARCCTSATSYGLMREAQKEILKTLSRNLTYWQSHQTLLMAPSRWQIYAIVKRGEAV